MPEPLHDESGEGGREYLGVDGIDVRSAKTGPMRHPPAT